jgi:uncharacterized protein YgiM (DUF1202 family)
LGADRQAWAVVLLVWAICGVLAWCLSETGRWSARHGWILAVLLLAVVAVGTSWWVTEQRTRGHRTAVVLEDTVEVLAGPGRNNATLATVHEGLDLEIRGERSEWIQVRLPNGVSGWVSESSVGVV